MHGIMRKSMAASPTSKRVCGALSQMAAQGMILFAHLDARGDLRLVQTFVKRCIACMQWSGQSRLPHSHAASPSGCVHPFTNI